ncbi:Error-prone DNA polymerase OS=Streptomyces antimycoticus OX=68175 GN=SANT12839_025910 PE=3 SV=1 [Streptomyces antimycoticus]
MRGVVQRRGPRRRSGVGSAVWNLAELAQLRKEGGHRSGRRGAGGGEAGDGRGGPARGRVSDSGRDSDCGRDSDSGRRIEMPTGYAMHPWADLQPAGDQAATGRKLWHASPGSAG